MKPLYSQADFDNATPKGLLHLECYSCKQAFQLDKHSIQRILNPKNAKSQRRSGKYCSNKCQGKSMKTKQTVSCANCSKEFEKLPSQIKKSKNHFCSRSCAATYNNKHKKYGTRRSKLEAWIEEQLTTMFPSLEMHFNQSEAIGSELDIYIPSLNVAFELNGIFHYEPIYGPDKLERIQENDQSKTKACHDAKIDLCVIDTSAQTYVKPKTSKKYLDIITKIIKERSLTS